MTLARKRTEKAHSLLEYMWIVSDLSFSKTGSVVVDFKNLILLSQIEACNKEAEKIESLINSDSPTLASHVPLSALIISQVQVSSSVPSAGIEVRAPCPFCLILLSLGPALYVVWTHN